VQSVYNLTTTDQTAVYNYTPTCPHAEPYCALISGPTYSSHSRTLLTPLYMKGHTFLLFTPPHHAVQRLPTVLDIAFLYPCLFYVYAAPPLTISHHTVSHRRLFNCTGYGIVHTRVFLCWCSYNINNIVTAPDIACIDVRCGNVYATPPHRITTLHHTVSRYDVCLDACALYQLLHCCCILFVWLCCKCNVVDRLKLKAFIK
jgi:hypothetical protein